jgi:hypothetical protein
MAGHPPKGPSSKSLAAKGLQQKPCSKSLASAAGTFIV